MSILATIPSSPQGSTRVGPAQECLKDNRIAIYCYWLIVLVLETSRRRWIDKNTVLEGSRKCPSWRQLLPARREAAGWEPPKSVENTIK